MLLDFGDKHIIVDLKTNPNRLETKSIEFELRRKLLLKGSTLTLAELQKIAIEAVDTQLRQMENVTPNQAAAQVNSVDNKQFHGKRTGPKGGKGQNRNRPNQNRPTRTCFRCGNIGHIARDANCPARDATCNKCKLKGHYAKLCKTKPERIQKERSPSSDKVNKVQSDNEYVFIVTDQTGSGLVEVNVGGVPISLLIDSGATCNVIGEETWKYLKANNVKCKSEKATKQLFAYGSQKPLNVLGKFQTTSEIDGEETNSEFFVIKGKADSLLGKKTAMAMRVLELGPRNSRIRKIETKEDVLEKFPKCFEGIGKLKDYEAK
ncbi:hypothetical protein BSL78_22161 [Apostichopus japonicus]|uniref:CCHC-type domain-containing protein n=1 Tax=Stichopus japonicus TaxID=307972 RepID=A0A2G8JZ18_STIJA|nr:hypothetical protein BSL78_22161 [Apostichopus japonicus]